MKKTAIIIPTGTAGDDWRRQALDYVIRRLEEHFPKIPIVLGELEEGEEWSKGAAIEAGIEQLDGDEGVLVLHDGDSFLRNRDQMQHAIAYVDEHPDEWVVPHKMVYRLKDRETERCYDHPERIPRRIVDRTPYYGPAGGGITILSPASYFEAGGVDARFLGWGGEDLAFGYALETLVGNPYRFEGQLFHLWHPHPAPDLRGSPASEDLVARYAGARGFPRRMEQLVRDGDWETLPELPDPVRFRMTANRKTLRLSGHEPIRFSKGIYDSTDPDEIEALRRHPYVSEDKRTR